MMKWSHIVNFTAQISKMWCVELQLGEPEYQSAVHKHMSVAELVVPFIIYKGVAKKLLVFRRNPLEKRISQLLTKLQEEPKSTVLCPPQVTHRKMGKETENRL